MRIVLILFAGAAVLELLVYLFARVKVLRYMFAVVALVVGTGAAGALVMTRLNVLSLLIAAVSLYRAFNMIRMVQGRMHERYLARATRRTGFKLMGLQAGFGLLWLAWGFWPNKHAASVWLIAAVVQLLVAIMLLLSVLRNLRRTTWPRHETHLSDHDLPTVTVAIPARNETEDLEACLRSIIASDYPKLEVIVLDDCSQIKRTPEIIRQFAHDGVRFVQGELPKETWLPKNQAYAHLAAEASGDYILFCGVDVRFAPHSIRSIVTTMVARKKRMISLLPERQASAYGQFSLIQAMRYYWELVPPRRYFNRPPVISSCWIIEAHALKKAGGFAAVARAIVPEAHFARELIASDGYSFLRSDVHLGVESNKTVRDQRDTAIRMRYPQLHKRPEQVALVTLLELGFLLMPFVMALSDGWLHIGAQAQIVAACASVFLIAVYECAALSTHVNSLLFGLIAQPFAIISDIVLLHYSMWKYEFSVVEWKGRNVCIPVMHVVPHLPEGQ